MMPPAKSAQELMVSCQGLVRSLAWKIHRKLPPQVDLEDLVGYGQVGLAEAARDFDPLRGGQFTTFAYYRIRGAILDGLSKMKWFDRNAYYNGRYERLANEVMDVEVGSEASPGGSGLEDDVRWLKGVGGALSTVHLFCQHSAGNETAEAAVVDPGAAAPPETAIQRETSRKLHELIDALPPEAATLIRAAYFEGLTLKEAGERIGISKAWASRLHARTLGQLARSLQSAQLAD